MENQFKPVPHSNEAEQAVIGSLLLDSQNINEVLDHVMPDDFFFRRHKIIFSEIVALHKNNKPIDPVILISKLESKLKDHVSCYIYEIINSTPSANNVVAYADIVRERSVLRQLMKITHETQIACLEGIEPNKILDATEMKIKLLAKTYDLE